MFCTEVSLCYGTKARTKHHLCSTITTPSVSGPTFALSGEIQAQVTLSTRAPFLYNCYNYYYSFSRDQFTQFKHHFWGGGGGERRDEGSLQSLSNPVKALGREVGCTWILSFFGKIPGGK